MTSSTPAMKAAMYFFIRTALIVVILSFCFPTPLLRSQDVSVQSGVLSLAQCLKIAETKNADLIIAREKMKEAESSYRGKLGLLFPKLDANLKYDRYKWQLPSKKQRFGESLNDWYAEAVLTLPLFKGGKDWNAIQAAKSVVEQETQSLEQKRRAVIFSVKKAYYERVRAAISLNIQKELVKNLEEQSGIAKLLYAGGKISAVDVLKVETQVASAKDIEKNLENALHIRSLALGRVLGTDSPVRTIDDIDPIDRTLSHSLACTEKGFSSNPELLAMKFQAEKFRYDAEAAYSAHYPSLSLIGNYNWEDKKFFPGNPNWNVGAALSIPIFHGGSDDAAIKEAQARLRQFEEKLADFKKDLAVRFEIAVSNISDSLNRLSTTEKVLILAEESYKTALLRYKSGKLSALELIDAQTVWFNARLNYKKLIIDSHIAIAEIEQICPHAVIEKGERK